MALYQQSRNGAWYYSIYIPGRAKRLRGTCSTHNRAEALILEESLKLATTQQTQKNKIIALINSLYGDDMPIKISIDAIPDEIARLDRVAGRDLSKSYQRRRRQGLNRFFAWLKKYWPPIDDVRKIDRTCAQLYSEFLHKSGISTKTRANLIGELSAIWSTLQRGHDNINNPWPLAAPRNANRRGNIGRCYTDEQAEKIFIAADRAGHGWGEIVRLAAATGLRYGDIATLTAAELCHDTHSLRLSPNKTKRHNISVTLPLPDDIWLRLPKPTTGPLWPRHAQFYKSEGQYKPYLYAKILRAAGINEPGLTIHSWRHYFRSRLSASGVSDDIAMRLGGWTSRETSARYDHAERLEELRAAINLAWKK